MKLIWSLLICHGLLVCAQSPSPLTLEKTIPMEKVQGRIDHMVMDIGRQRLFVAALGNDTVEVIDLRGGQDIQSVSGFAEPQGIAFVSELDRIFVANGRDGTCRMIDGRSFKTMSSVPCGDDADNVRYDEQSKRIYVGYGRGALAVLDAKTGTKLSDIKLDGHPESFRLERSGTRIFVNVPQANAIMTVDREKAAVVHKWLLEEAKSNFPLILDEDNHRLFTGCRTPARVLVYDSTGLSGHAITSLPISRDTDDMYYDAANRLLYVSCGQGLIDIIKQLDADHYKTISTIQTAPGTRTSLFVPELKVFCVAVPRRGNQSAQIRVFKTP